VRELTSRLIWRENDLQEKNSPILKVLKERISMEAIIKGNFR
jgi:hypothetical protein